MFEDLLARLARGLDDHAIPYMVIGGQAVLLYGEPRLTRDIDITLGATPERLAEVLAVAEAADLESLVDAERFTRETMVLPCADPTTGIRVDFVFSFSPYEQQALARARSVRIGGTPVRFVSPEDLVIHKVIAGRPRDLEDARGVLHKHPALDLAYVRLWLNEFESDLGEPFTARLDALLADTQ